MSAFLGDVLTHGTKYTILRTKQSSCYPQLCHVIDLLAIFQELLAKLLTEKDYDIKLRMHLRKYIYGFYSLFYQKTKLLISSVLLRCCSDLLTGVPR